MAQSAFLGYLTVFKSRIGATLLALRTTGFGHQSDAQLERALRRVLEERREVAVDDPENHQVLEYLTAKNLVGARASSKGRYVGWSLERGGGEWLLARNGERRAALPVFQTDLWLSDPAVRSTVGVPTPENVGEVVEMSRQLRLISRAKNTWTAQGQLVDALRENYGEATTVNPANPFTMGAEGISLLSRILAEDGLMLREVLRLILQGGAKVSRDDIAGQFETAVDRAVDAAKPLMRPEALREAREFQKLINRTVKKAKKKDGSKGPGVLEHRVSPRLEWLTDFGYLSKEGLPPNGFGYRVSESAKPFLNQLEELDGDEASADRIAISEWNKSPAWEDLRERMPVEPGPNAFISAYHEMRRRVGPAPLREVTFVAAVLRREPLDEMAARITEFAQETDGVTLAGGARSRNPTNIFMPDSALPPVD
jgi:hypothetical protein